VKKDRKQTIAVKKTIAVFCQLVARQRSKQANVCTVLTKIHTLKNEAIQAYKRYEQGWYPTLKAQRCCQRE